MADPGPDSNVPQEWLEVLHLLAGPNLGDPAGDSRLNMDLQMNRTKVVLSMISNSVKTLSSVVRSGSLSE